MGTSAPAILSTGASRYSKLSSMTDVLLQRKTTAQNYHADAESRAAVISFAWEKKLTRFQHQHRAAEILLQLSQACWSSSQKH